MEGIVISFPPDAENAARVWPRTNLPKFYRILIIELALYFDKLDNRLSSKGPCPEFAEGMLPYSTAPINHGCWWCFRLDRLVISCREIAASGTDRFINILLLPSSQREDRGIIISYPPDAENAAHVWTRT